MPAPSAASAAYQILFCKCLTSRVPVDHFENYTRQLFSRSPLSPASIAAELVSPAVSPIVDPLQLRYIQKLVETNFLSISEVLIALSKSSNAIFLPAATAFSNTEEEIHEARTSRELVEAGVILVLAGAARFQKPKSPEYIWTTLAAVSQWMDLSMGSTRSMKSREGVAELVIALGQNEDVIKVWSGSIGITANRDLRGPFTSTLAAFTQRVSAETPIATVRMDGLFQYQRSPGQQQQGKTDLLSLIGGGGASSGLDVMGLSDSSSKTWARSSGIVWIDSLLVGLPLTDEDSILLYLTSRYRDDTSSMASEFVLASFDTLAASMNPLHPASSSQTFLVRSFIINKVPLILTRIFLPQDTLNAVLSQVLLRIDPGILNNTSGNPFGGNGDMFSLPADIRQEFLFACALHGLIEEVSIQGILGELPMMTLPASGRYVTEELASQCQLDPDRVERLLEELEGLDGNAGAVTLAVVDVIRGMCEKKETMSLKSICSFLTRKPSSIDVIFLFIKPAYLLGPLCVLLDTWRYEEDQGEYQPVYEDFGYILLLLLTIIHRYDLPLTAATLGPSADHIDSFIPCLLTKGLTARQIEEFESNEKHAQLGGWIKEIFEAEGISDGLMSSCRPQDFYMLVPTLFLQSIMAAQGCVLDIETLKEGFVYLLEPFLMPSLVSALTWLGNYVWENSSASAEPEDILTTPLQILQALVVPLSTLSVEASMVHQTVLSITARHLERVVREVVRSMDHAAPQASHITGMADAVLQAVNPHLTFKRSGTASHHELEGWVSNTGTHHQHGMSGGLVPTLRATFAAQVAWSAANPSGGSTKTASAASPPAYTHRLIQSVAQALGSRVLVSTLVDILCSLHKQHIAASSITNNEPNTTTEATPSSSVITGNSSKTAMNLELALDLASVVIVSPTRVSFSSPPIFCPRTGASSSNNTATNPRQVGGIHSSSPHPQVPSQTPSVSPAMSPLSLLDALRLQASDALASITPTTAPTTQPETKSAFSKKPITRTPRKLHSKQDQTPPQPSPTQPRAKPNTRTEILIRLAKKVEALLTPHTSQAILPPGTVRAITSAPAPAVSNAPGPSAAGNNPVGGSGVGAGSGADSGGDDMLLMGMGFGNGFGSGFGGMDLDFGGADGELDLLGEFDASGMDLG